jgi:hypothetical protein
MPETNVQAEPTYRQATINDADAISSVITEVVKEPNPVAFERALSPDEVRTWISRMGGEGGAFLAHASRCSTAWYSFARAGQSFTPAIELGPATAPGETAAAYATRLHAFYVEKLADIFTGDPRNIELIGRWGRAFARAGVENRANSGKNTPPVNRWGAARGKIQK